MDSNPPGSTPSPQDPQLVAKLRGLERMWVAGLIDEGTYRAKLEQLQAQIDRGGAAPAAPTPAPVLRREAPPVPPRPEAPAPPPLVVSTPPPPPPVAAPAPTPSAAERPAAVREVLPAEPAAAPAPTGPPGLRGVVVASAITLGVLLAAAVITVLVLRAHSTGTVSDLSFTPVPTRTPDAVSALSAQRIAPASLPGVVMDASDAEKLVRAYWPVREGVLSRHDTLSVRELETGAAAQWDSVGCSIGCARLSPRTLNAVNVFVPKQATYPAAFLAEVLTTEYQHSSTTMVELMIFTRPAADAPWSLALDTGYTGVDSLHEFPVPLEGGAFDDAAPQVNGVDQHALPAMLAAYLQHWIVSGSAPPGSPLRDGSFTSTQGQALHEQVLEDRANGIADTISYSPGVASDGLWTFAVKEEVTGGETGSLAMTCGVVRYAAVANPARSGANLVQGQGFSPFGTLLQPGAYRSVTELGLHQSCFVSGTGLPGIVVVGNNGSAVRATGVSARS